MIKLDLSKKPSRLTKSLEKQLLKKFHDEGKDVWNATFIREAVLGFSNSKCCYSECKLQVESVYMEVDHFLPKKHFPNKVVEWGNLLPSCKKCNTTKGELNTAVNPIINPLVNDPKTELFILNYRYYAKTNLGKTTITYTGINDRTRFVLKRFIIGDKIISILDELHEAINEDPGEILKGGIKAKRFINKFKETLSEGTRENEYSASTSTTILANRHFKEIEFFLKENKLWDTELEEIKSELNFCSLPD